MPRKAILTLLVVYCCACFAGGFFAGANILPMPRPYNVGGGNNASAPSNVTIPDPSLASGIDNFTSVADANASQSVPPIAPDQFADNMATSANSAGTQQ